MTEYVCIIVFSLVVIKAIGRYNGKALTVNANLTHFIQYHLDIVANTGEEEFHRY